MNVKVVNKYESLLNNIDIDIIKSITGVFTPEELLYQFNNFFYNKMVLDITAIANYQDIKTIQDLSVNMDMSKVVLLLDDSAEVNSPKYLSSLVSMGIYNFTRDVNTIPFLIENPNVYKDVARYHQLDAKMEEEEEVKHPKKEKEKVKEKNRDKDKKEIKDSKKKVSESVGKNMRIIGIKNVTEHAGSTTLTYMLKKQLEKQYKVSVVEINCHDFVFLNDKSLKNINHYEVQQFISSNYESDVILIDLNEDGPLEFCTDVLYLIEPGLIKLNKLIRKDPKIFEKLKGKKIILNRSVLNSTDVSDFEYESHSKVFYNIPYLDDKLDNHSELIELLILLGFERLGMSSSKNGKMFDVFK